MAILNIQRKFEYEYQILQVRTLEGGCEETIIDSGFSTLEQAILTFETTKVEDNCENYIIVSYTEKKNA